MSQRNWTRDETILAFELYCTIPSSKVTIHNEDVVSLARLLGRTPGAVKLKIQNFKSFDSSYTADGRVGLSHGSKTDKEVVEDFIDHWDKMILEADNVRKKLGLPVEYNEIAEVPHGHSQEQTVRVRIGQSFFRKAVLSAYRSSCCVTGIELPELLIASHIKPWSASDDGKEKVNPQNGLCLNAFHDKAFDKGLFTLSLDYQVIVSETVKSTSNDTLISLLLAYEGRRIFLPTKFLPKKEYLEYHNDVVFRR